MFFHRLRLLVPPFPLESINWPSYLNRLKVRAVCVCVCVCVCVVCAVNA